MFEKKELYDLQDFLLLAKTFLFNMDRTAKYKQIEFTEGTIEYFKAIKDYDNMREENTIMISNLDSLLKKISGEINAKI